MILRNYFFVYKVLLIVYHFCFKLIPNVQCQNQNTNKSFEKFDKETIEKEYQKSLQISKNVSRILDHLLKGYDKRLRPNYAGPPITIGITININNINSVSEVNMDYTMDIFLRQLWTDKRLSFNGVSELVIGSDMLHKIWLPDTYIANDRRTYFHKATVQNKFIRIKPDGSVLYSMRLTVTAACPMHFQYFPMDYQHCDLDLESYGFRMEDIIYKWAQGLNLSFNIEPTIELPQLKYKDYLLVEREFKLSTGLYSRLTMRLYFLRSLVYYIIQIYIPSTLIVVLSWVSFWLDRTAAPARVSLGITTVLTMVTFIWSTNASLPKISYVKSIDVFLVCCFLMTFASVIEYAMVSYIHIKNERRKRKKREQLVEVEHQNQIYDRLAMLSRTNSQTNNLNNEYSMGKRTRDFTTENIFMPDREESSSMLSPNNESHFRNRNFVQNQNHLDKESYIAGSDSPIIWDKSMYNGDDMAETSFLDPRNVPMYAEKSKPTCSCNHHHHHQQQQQQPSISRQHHGSNSNLNNTFSSRKQSPRLIVKNGNLQLQPTMMAMNQPSYNSRLQQNQNEFSIQRYRSSGSINYQNENKKELTRSYATIDPNNFSTNLRPNSTFNVIEPLSAQQDSPSPYFLNSSSISSRKKRSCLSFRIKAAKIDHVSRVIFPVMFFIFHIIYWTYYLQISTSTG